MGKITTRELLDMFYEKGKSSSIKNIQSHLDKIELFQFEKKIGKELVDMDIDELYDLILFVRNRRNGVVIDTTIAHRSIDQITTGLRTLFDFYTDHVQPIRNPMRSDRMKGTEIVAELTKRTKPFTTELMEDVINRLHNDVEKERADYIELVIRMFYDGFDKIEQMARLKEEMIDHDKHTVKLLNRTVQLSDRTYQLLTEFNKIDSFEAWRGYNAVVGWRGSYFKFIIRESNVKTFDDRDLTGVNDIVTRQFARFVNDAYNVKFNGNLLFILGFYDRLVKEVGEENVKEFLLKEPSPELKERVMAYVNKTGFPYATIFELKRKLTPFISR